jgi:hypothetical protein
VLRRRAAEATVATRTNILHAKQATSATLAKKAEGLARIRRIANAQAQLRKQNKVCARAAAEDAQRCVQDASLRKLVGQLEAKRSLKAADRARLAAEEKRATFMKHQNAAGSSQVSAQNCAMFANGSLPDSLEFYK